MSPISIGHVQTLNSERSLLTASRYSDLNSPVSPISTGCLSTASRYSWIPPCLPSLLVTCRLLIPVRSLCNPWDLDNLSSMDSSGLPRNSDTEGTETINCNYNINSGTVRRRSIQSHLPPFLLFCCRQHTRLSNWTFVAVYQYRDHRRSDRYSSGSIGQGWRRRDWFQVTTDRINLASVPLSEPNWLTHWGKDDHTHTHTHTHTQRGGGRLILSVTTFCKQCELFTNTTVWRCELHRVDLSL